MISNIAKVEEYQDFRMIPKGFEKVNGIYVHHSLLDKLDCKIYRYTSFEYLLDMIRKGKLYVSRRTKFDDKREVGRKQNPKNVFPPSPVEENEELQKKSAQWTYGRWVRAYNSFVSCWTYGNRQCDDGESYFMWKAYANNGVGCRIGSTIMNLIDSVEVDNGMAILLKGVEYRNKERIADNDIEHYCFDKDTCYYDENEIRLCIIDNSNSDSETHPYADSYQLKIDMRKLIQEVIISPFIPKDYLKFHADQFISQYPEYAKVLKKSHLLIG